MSPKGKRALEIISASVFALFVIVLFLVYLYHRDLQKKLAGLIAEKSTAFIGQRVDIKDLSVSKGRVDLYNIVVGNPEGFAPGNLLSIRRLSMKIEMGDLMSGRFNFRDIGVFSPELTIVRDSGGRFNISDRLLSFLEKKPSIKYRIDEFTIDSGKIIYNGNLSPLLTRRAAESISRIDPINFHIQSLSSDPGVKTVITGSASYLGGRISLEGWVYLKDNPRRFAISVSSEDIGLVSFQEMLSRYKIDARRSKLGLSLSAGTDTENSVNFAVSLGVRDTEFPFLKTGLESVSAKAGGSFHPKDASVLFTDISVDAKNMLIAHAKAVVKDLRKSPAYEAEIKLSRLDLSALKLPQDLGISGIAASDRLTIKGKSVRSLPALHGAFSLRDVSVSRSNKKLIQKVSVDSRAGFDGNALDVNMRAKAGKLSFRMNAKAANVLLKTRAVHMRMELPAVKLSDIRDAFWDTFPDRLLYAGLDGSLASDATADYREGDIKVNGSLTMKGVNLTGENGEFSVGPVSGTLPLFFHKAAKEDRSIPAIQFPVFDKAHYSSLKESYAGMPKCEDCARITVGSVGYGFKLLDNVDIGLKQEGSILNIKLFSGNISGGKINGAAFVDISKGMNYRAGFILEGLSLRKFCDGVEPIKGYISGKVDGVAAFKGTGSGLANLIGKADFWTYGTDDERTKISREFLQKVGGLSLKAYLGDRKFDKGIVSLYLQDGFIIFDQLEISNKNLLGMTDLSVKVAPYNNRISLDHLMWTITEAAQRAQKNKE